jgi:O-antigen ligase
MLGPLFVFPLLVFVCLGALYRPAIGAIGYYGFVLLQPEWNWRWSLPKDFQYQKYIAIATLLGLLINGLRGNRWPLNAKIAGVGLTGFIGLAFLSAQFSIWPDASVFYLDILWKIVLLAVVSVHVLDSARPLQILAWVATLAQGYNAYQINLDYFQRGYCLYAMQSWGDNGDNNLYSILTVPLIGLSAGLMLCSRPLWQKLLAGAIFTLQMHQIMLMESRGCMLGCLAMAPLLLWLMPKTVVNWSAVVTAFVLGGALAGPPVVKEFTSSFKQEGERDSSAESRFQLWKAGAAITGDYPLLGVGPYAGQRLVPQYGGFPSDRKALHNLVFEISTGCGIPAVMLYLSFFATAWWASWQGLHSGASRRPPEWACAIYIAAAGGLPGYFVASMFSSGALLESSYMVAAMALATTCVLARDQLDSLSPEFSDEITIGNGRGIDGGW